MSPQIQAALLGSTNIDFRTPDGRIRTARASFITLTFVPSKSAPFREIFLSISAYTVAAPCRILQGYPYSVVDGESFKKDESSPFKAYHLMDNCIRLDWQAPATARAPAPPPTMFLYLVVDAPSSQEVGIGLEAMYGTEAPLWQRLSPSKMWPKKVLRAQLVLEKYRSLKSYEPGHSRSSTSTTPMESVAEEQGEWESDQSSTLPDRKPFPPAPHHPLA